MHEHGDGHSVIIRAQNVHNVIVESGLHGGAFRGAAQQSFLIRLLQSSAGDFRMNAVVLDQGLQPSARGNQTVTTVQLPEPPQRDLREGTGRRVRRG